jgi:hypothetical protein
MSTAAEDLPHVDEHATEIAADVGTVWEALLRVVEGSFSSVSTVRIASVLGCTDVRASGLRPLAVGSSLPGFQVKAAERPGELALVGSHRFSEYALIFRLDDLAQTRTRLQAETRAKFPGVKGSLYRTLVIRTRGHVLVTRRLLGAIKQRAEHASATC